MMRSLLASREKVDDSSPLPSLQKLNPVVEGSNAHLSIDLEIP